MVLEVPWLQEALALVVLVELLQWVLRQPRALFPRWGPDPVLEVFLQPVFQRPSGLFCSVRLSFQFWALQEVGEVAQYKPVPHELRGNLRDVSGFLSFENMGLARSRHV